MSQKLMRARKYEREAGEKIQAKERPGFHLTPQAGWMNDPNGFSFYKGQYHLFYQYNPYRPVWDSMHWGHAVSRDLLHWTYLPAALAPDEDYDAQGCFSGSAVELDDGRQLLLYTGVHRGESAQEEETQVQCVAVGNGTDYEKYRGNPVVGREKLPPGRYVSGFRDPKIWREADGSFRCVVGSVGEDGLGAVLLYKSRDGFQWEFVSTLIKNDGRFGTMWECPDFFSLNGRHVLLVSPEDMLPVGREYCGGNGTLCLIGTLDNEGRQFTAEKDQPVDCGLDFYAPQTTLTPDGRRVMVGWMQNWDSCTASGSKGRPWFGQMSLPRELTVKNGWLFQQPVRELEQLRSGRVQYRDVAFCGALLLEKVEGRTAELELTVRPREGQALYRSFTVRLAQNSSYYTSLSFQPRTAELLLDREHSGSRRAYLHRRSCTVSGGERLTLRIIIDRFSIEAFVNDGERVMSATIFTPPEAAGISFCSDGYVVMDVTKYDLS